MGEPASQLTKAAIGQELPEIPIDLGIIHYASDTPYTRAQTLGARGLSYFGIDSTYASTLVILRRVFQQAIAADDVLRAAQRGVEQPVA